MQYQLSATGVIERAPGAHPDTVAYLESRGKCSIERTPATGGSLAADAFGPGGDAAVALVYWHGDRRATFRSGIRDGVLEEPAACTPAWPWDQVEVTAEPIASPGDSGRGKAPRGSSRRRGTTGETGKS